MLSDLSLVDYIAVSKTAQLFLPHTQGRYQMRRFRKALCPIVERLVCSMMMHGRNNGKKLMAVRIVKHAFEIIHLLTDKNPIQVFVDAVKNGGPREDSTRVGSAGVVRRQAVDVSPLRRVNQAIYLICTGARNSAFRNIKSISECLADEIMNCAKESSNSYAIKPLDFWIVSFRRGYFMVSKILQDVFSDLSQQIILQFQHVWTELDSLHAIVSICINISQLPRKKDEIERVAKANR